MAMKPFAGYNFGDYWAHWFKVGARLTRPPQLFHVNWFRQDSEGHFLWPGFGENLRVLAWMLERCAGRAGARETAIGQLPGAEDLNVAGLGVPPSTLEALTAVPRDAWQREVVAFREYLVPFKDRCPPGLLTELDALEQRLKN
jgi:phosphoenolpyruvate carboxykinase (GTP)